MSEIDPRIVRVCEGYKRTVYDKDAEGFLGLYDKEARVFDTWGIWSYENAGDRRKAIEGWFSSLGNERVKVTFERMRAEVGRDLATLSARVTYAGLSAEGVELRSMQNRLSWALRLGGDRCTIVHEHTSVPIGYNDLKGILRNE
jgi:hypothetical protein